MSKPPGLRSGPMVDPSTRQRPSNGVTSDDVSVVIPAFNAASTIERSVRSALWQSEPPAEVLVVENGEPDGTEAIVKNFGDPRVKFLRSEQPGTSTARNLGASFAERRYLAFLDADDIWYPDKFAHQLPLLNEDIAVVGSLMHYLSPTGKVLGTNARYENAELASQDLRRGISMPLAMSTWVVPTELLLQAGGFDPSFRRAQDFELAVRLTAGGKSIDWPSSRALVGYVIHSDAVTATSYEEQFYAAELVRHRLSNPNSSVGYDDWMGQISSCRRITMSAASGRCYRRAAVAVGKREFVTAARNMALAALLDPRSVIDKMRWRVRDVGEIHPSLPPVEVLKMLAVHDG